ncbi:unnamed protein product [Hyaloperonospora brassicae]|uniref:Photolyase/cryptochrome alpha/beta domain-containing protein n=1 Tax=Hyaloperonospora brassicae TaxID=162125 RepID=A0AAV0TQE9_HYABA|nr:unnamed protein product [Hyaloperonospora brassicae]
MSAPNAVDVRRIAAQVAALEQQRAEGTLPHDDKPLRLYQVNSSSGFVRVLDQHPEPISQDMLDAISAFIAKTAEQSDRHETTVAGEKTKTEADETTRNEPTDAVTVVRAADTRHEHEKIDTGDDTVRVCANGNAILDANVSVTGDTVLASDCATSDVHRDTHCVRKKPQVRQSAEDIPVLLSPPWDSAGAVKQLTDLLDCNEKVSDILDKEMAINDGIRTLSEPNGIVEDDDDDDNDDDGDLVAKSEHKVLESMDQLKLLEQWPPQLKARRKVWFVPPVAGRKTRDVRVEHRSVVYWMHNTLRVMQGNYGLEAAILLSRRLTAPLVVVCLVSSSIVHPVCHATTASDAYARYSLVELYQQFKQAGVPFFGLTATESERLELTHGPHVLSPKPHPLYELMDAFEPHAVVTDAMFDPSGRRDVAHLARYLELHRSSCSWSLLSMDSMTCCPAYQLSKKLQRTFEHDSMFASEEDFGAEYASCMEPRSEVYVFSSLPRAGALDAAANKRHSEMVSAVVQRLHLEEINWQVVRAENVQSNARMRRFSEGEGLQKLSQLLSDRSSQPAIQTELHGGGVLSLLPFIRHGTLFVGYVLRRMDEAITSCPTPTTPHKRKALAMRKVMRSRAAHHLARERDYALYLSLWSTSSTSMDPGGSGPIDIALLSTSEIIAGLRSDAPRPSSLEAYQKILPAWACSAARMADNCNDHVTGAASYDPFELESARTNDSYWNEIQKLLVEQQYLHPLLIVYWAYRVFTWSVSCRAAVATVESLISQCALGSCGSPDAVFVVWKLLFRLGSNSTNATSVGDSKTNATPEHLRQFQQTLENELASQPKLQLRS